MTKLRSNTVSGRNLRFDVTNIRLGKFMVYFSTSVVLITLIYGIPSLEDIPNFSDLMKEETVQEYRMRTMKNFCSKQMAFSEKTSRNMLVSHKFKSLYCFVPNAASSFWKRQFIERSARGHEFTGGYRDIDKSEILKRYGLHLQHELTWKQKEYVEDDYYKFVFLRHPLTRVVSSFHEFISNLPDEKEMQYLQEIIVQLNSGNDISKMNLKKFNTTEETAQPKIDFEQFVNFITRPRHGMVPLEIESNWASYNELCNPCHFNYDYVGFLEDYEIDLDYLMDKIFNDAKYDFTELMFESIDIHEAKRLLNTLSAKTRRHLREKYKDDMEMFGYKWEMFFLQHTEAR